MNEQEIKDILMQSDLIPLDELKKIIEDSAASGTKLTKLIVDRNLIGKEQLYQAIAKKINVEYRKLDDMVIPSEEVLRVYPQDLASTTRSVPIFIKNGIFHIAMEDPIDVFEIDQIQLLINYPIEIYLSSPEEIENALNLIYTKTETGKQDIFGGYGEIGEESVMTEQGASFGDSEALGGVTSIIKILDLIIAQSIKDRASDIHIEPEENITRIRFRIDGVLYEIPSPPKEWESAIISRVKVLANMDIAESRMPQDGHFQQIIDDRVIDCRVSTLPTIYGENVVIRLLESSTVNIGLERLGFTTSKDLEKYEKLLARPYGIILSTGPTGSGKTTTLYSALMRINMPDKNIITLEDPVEYRLGLIRQVQINPKAGITFSNGLRAILRQDPDVIMVGEIRDLETAKMAIEAALTGHLVFSTLHTNDAPSSIARLLDMGVDSFLVAASIVGVVAQRLVRTICSKCKETYQPTKATLKKWGLEEDKNLVVYRGKGCSECKGTGYKGRTGLFELMVVDDEMKEMINQGTSIVAIKKKAQEKEMRLLWEDGREKVLQGITTFEEVSRVCDAQIDLAPKQEQSGTQQSEIKPYVSLEQDILRKKDNKLKTVKVDNQAVEGYSNRMARWLSGKE